MPFKETIGEQIKTLRKRKDFTQEELGEAINSCRSNIAKIETGKKELTVREYIDICKALKCTPEEIAESLLKMSGFEYYVHCDDKENAYECNNELLDILKREITLPVRDIYDYLKALRQLPVIRVYYSDLIPTVEDIYILSLSCSCDGSERDIRDIFLYKNSTYSYLEYAGLKLHCEEYFKNAEKWGIGKDFWKKFIINMYGVLISSPEKKKFYIDDNLESLFRASVKCGNSHYVGTDEKVNLSKILDLIEEGVHGVVRLEHDYDIVKYPYRDYLLKRLKDDVFTICGHYSISDMFVYFKYSPSYCDDLLSKLFYFETCEYKDSAEEYAEFEKRYSGKKLEWDENEPYRRYGVLAVTLPAGVEFYNWYIKMFSDYRKEIDCGENNLYMNIKLLSSYIDEELEGHGELDVKNKMECANNTTEECERFEDDVEEYEEFDISDSCKSSNSLINIFKRKGKKND